MSNERGEDALTKYDVAETQAIGKKSVNDFTSADIQATRKVAEKYWRDYDLAQIENITNATQVRQNKSAPLLAFNDVSIHSVSDLFAAVKANDKIFHQCLHKQRSLYKHHKFK